MTCRSLGLWCGKKVTASSLGKCSRCSSVVPMPFGFDGVVGVPKQSVLLVIGGSVLCDFGIPESKGKAKSKSRKSVQKQFWAFLCNHPFSLQM